MSANRKTSSTEAPPPRPRLLERWKNGVALALTHVALFLTTCMLMLYVLTVMPWMLPVVMAVAMLELCYGTSGTGVTVIAATVFCKWAMVTWTLGFDGRRFSLGSQDPSRLEL